MAAVILPFALTADRQVRGSTPPDPAPRGQGWMTVDLDGAVSPLRGKLPPAAGRFAEADAAPRRRVPAEAILAIGRRMLRATPVAQGEIQGPAGGAKDPAAPRPRMPRKHKLMLLTAAAVLYTGGMEARRHFKPRAVLIEVPSTRAHAIAALPAPMRAA